MLLVDVREPNETAVESYPDAVIVPLSCFDRREIPDPQGKQVVFACRSGPPLGDGLARRAGRRAIPTRRISPAASSPGRRPACRPKR